MKNLDISEKMVILRVRAKAIKNVPLPPPFVHFIISNQLNGELTLEKIMNFININSTIDIDLAIDSLHEDGYIYMSFGHFEILIEALN